MEQESKTGLHPLIAGAAVGVIMLSLVGVAAITGYLPGSSAQKAPEQQAAQESHAQAQAERPAHKPGANASAPKHDANAPKHDAGAPKQQVASAATHAQAKSRCADCGVILEVKEMEVKGEGTGLGAVAGGVAGAVIGNEIGEGRGRTVATVVGAAGGAFAGNEIEKHARTKKRFDVSVRMEDGSTKTVSSATQPSWRSGDRVRVLNGKIEPI